MRERMRVEKEIRNRYGRFFYRFPNGESAADVYDRITGFRETLRADIDIGRFQPPGQRTKNVNLVIVSHGLALRVFLMRWYKWTVDQFEGLTNFSNGGTMVMEIGTGGRLEIKNALEYHSFRLKLHHFDRYSLLVHHTEEELRKFGLTDEMLADQDWYKIAALFGCRQRTSRPGELNYECMVTGPDFFTHFGRHFDYDPLEIQLYVHVIFSFGLWYLLDQSNVPRR
ncbi:hypothetical protein ACLOJK_032256 [Asimina triloba]